VEAVHGVDRTGCVTNRWQEDTFMVICFFMPIVFGLLAMAMIGPEGLLVAFIVAIAYPCWRGWRELN
jgi:hypothetical protein